MRKVWLMLPMLALGVGIGLKISSKLTNVEAQTPGAGQVAVIADRLAPAGVTSVGAIAVCCKR
ncbi:MAG TPA: hypothetical protein VNX70_07980 [Bryobacteraceae bacterium]|nr:hypothetical protein [Bryobacteraceae bacterium]